MDWIALRPSHEGQWLEWGWQALRFTPRVARVEDAVLLEASASHRLFGGPEALLAELLAPPPLLAPAAWGRGPTSPVALALLRLRLAGCEPPARLPHDLPLALLDAAVPHVPLLERSGLRTWGQLRALPRGPLARRFGAALLEALDIAWGLRPEAWPWLTLPEAFDQRLELLALATDAPQLMPAVRRLLSQLQLWLRARQQGVLAFELEWTLDLRRLDGRPLPPHERLVLRTARPVQAMDHLQRLAQEQLDRASLAAPASHLRLRTLETVAWAGASLGFLPEDRGRGEGGGEPLHQLVERLSARLGADRVLVPRLQADWRPERMQRWEPAAHGAGGEGGVSLRPAPMPLPPAPDLYPPWLLEEPLRLPVHDERPWHEGRPLQLLTRRQRVETGWWEPGGAVVRDYCVARSERAGLLCVFREQGAGPDAAPARWYLQGFYA